MLHRRLWLAVAVAVLPVLAGCDSFGLGTPPPPIARALDYGSDDLASLVLALDLPTNLQPVAKGTVATFDVTTAARGSRHLKAVLVLADGDAIDGALPPPATGRTYYLLGFADRDRAAFAEAQKWLAALPPDAAAMVAFHVAPRLCETAALDPSVASVAVVPALPGSTRLLPILGPEPVMTLIGGGQLPPCGSV